MEMHLSLVLEVFDGEFFAALGFITSQRGLRCFIVGLPQNVLNLGAVTPLRMMMMMMIYFWSKFEKGGFALQPCLPGLRSDSATHPTQMRVNLKP